MTEEFQITAETGRYRARDVEYVSGGFDQILKRIPEFELTPFRVNDKLPANPNLQCVVRKPLSAPEQLMPVGVVSNTYTLVQHRTVAELCKKALLEGKLDLFDLKCELGLTPLGEYMVFRIYMPDQQGFTAKDGYPTSLRVECINSVDGSHRLVVFYSWLRLVCQNGMMVRNTKTEVRELHNQNLDLKDVASSIQNGLSEAAADIQRLKEWDDQNIDLNLFQDWVDETLSDKWKKKAASKVYHLARTGHDSEWVDPFEGGATTSKRVYLTSRVPGAKEQASSFYDIMQALTWVASQRTNVEERVEWQSQVPALMESLQKAAKAGYRFGGTRIG